MISREWPALPFSDWEDTCDTVHMWTQIIGKTRKELTPLMNHWWNVTLYVTPRGLTTSAMPFHQKTFDVEFDFVEHLLAVRTSEGDRREIPLRPFSVADFYAEYMAALHALGIDIAIHRVPDEFDDKTPFDQDHRHASYDRESIENFHQILIQCDQVFKEFRSRFTGKCSPVHFFWGSFDLAVSRFCGRRAPMKPDADPITREAYSEEVISCGFWPGDRRFKNAAFYSYTAPAPRGIEKEAIQPQAAYWDKQLGEFILKYDDVRTSDAPAQAILDFCQSTYEAGARLAHWDRSTLERKPIADAQGG